MKKTYIKPIITMIGDDGDCPLMAGSKWQESQKAVKTISSDQTYEDGIQAEIWYVTDDTGSTPIANSKMHDLWDEW